MFRNKSLRFKFNFLVSVFTLLNSVMLGSVLIFLARYYLREELVKRGEVMVRRLAESHAYQVSLGLADELQPIINRMITMEKGIEYVEFVDATGKIIQTSDGKYRAQGNVKKRPPEYDNFNLDALKDFTHEGRTIAGANGQKLYDFHAPVRMLVDQSAHVQPMELGMLGEGGGLVELINSQTCHSGCRSSFCCGRR